MRLHRDRRSFLSACICGMFAACFASWSAAQAADAPGVALHDFGKSPLGAPPPPGPFSVLNGNVYLTVPSGGSEGAGAIIQVGSDAQQTVLYNFTGGADGAWPNGNLACDSSGNLYGTAAEGGAGREGTVFKLDPSGKLTVLYTFRGAKKGATPYGSGLSRDVAGNLYGTTVGGGDFDYGTVFKVDPTGQESVLYSFTSFQDGGSPSYGVGLDAAGNLYGVSDYGGPLEIGCVFKVTPSGQKSILHNFTGGVDGQRPTGLVIDAAGNLYGSTSGGGPHDLGAIFKIDTSGVESVLHLFAGGEKGQSPGPIVVDQAGNIHGAATYGGSSGEGLLFKVDAKGHYSVLYSLPGAIGGENPLYVAWTAGGNLYGTTWHGGPYNYGVLFNMSLTRGLEGASSLASGLDGSLPRAALLRDAQGNYYGTTGNGGAANAGTVYKLAPNGREEVLYAFTGGADGNTPYAGVASDGKGNLYGTTFTGGASNAGVVFRLDETGHQSVLYSFTGGADGRGPVGGVIVDSAGNIYGTASIGGDGPDFGYGTVFKLDPYGNQTVLHSFAGGTDGWEPEAGLIADSSGNLYGTTAQGGSAECGVVFKITAGGQESVLHTFTGPDGCGPAAGLTFDAAGNLYGTTQNGGTGKGVVFKLDPSGNLTLLHSFTGLLDGGLPTAAVVLDSAGNVYGTATRGGTSRAGVAFMIDPSGAQTILHNFTAGVDGATPNGGVLDSAGHFTVTTYGGGFRAGGVVFQITP